MGRGRGHAAVTGVGWAVLGTANIAAKAFLPALRAAGGGRAVVVGSRDSGRAQRWATEFGVESGVGNYEQALADPRVRAVYVALPNTDHLRWAAAALDAGKTVLCEKPLTPSPADTAALLEVARTSPGLLWESFVFPFHPQTARLQGLLADGSIGELQGISSGFHFRVGGQFRVGAAGNIRLDPALAGGAVFDVGCYPVRLARLLFGAEPTAAAGYATVGESGVDEDVTAVMELPGGRRLAVTAGLRRARDTYSRLQGSAGTIEVANAFHPVAGDLVRVSPEAGASTGPVDHEAAAGSVFEHAIRHIHDVLAGDAEPRELAVDDALGQARAVALLRGALGLAEPPPSSR